MSGDEMRSELSQVSLGIGSTVLGLLMILMLVALGQGCGTVTVTAEREGRCRIRPEAPFEVRCWSDGREVLVWKGPMHLTVEEKQ